MGKLFKFLFALLALAIAGFGAVLAFGTGASAPELASITAPFRSVDFSGLPKLQTMKASRGGPIAYRRYGPDDAADVVLLLHGSTASSASMHPLAASLAAQKMAVYVPDIRGHGETGKRGDLDGTGQLHDDLEMLLSFIGTHHSSARLSMVGFSAGGGLALRFAGSPEGHLVSRYVLVAPALGPSSPATRTSGDLWATPHVPRIIALTLLNRIGISALNGMEAIRFAVPPESGKMLTPSYSYRLLNELLPKNYAADLRRNVRPMLAVLAEKDELFDLPLLRRSLMDVRADISVSIVPNTGHIGLILEPAGMEAIARAIRGEGVEDRPDETDADGVRAQPATPPANGG